MTLCSSILCLSMAQAPTAPPTSARLCVATTPPAILTTLMLPEPAKRILPRKLRILQQDAELSWISWIYGSSGHVMSEESVLHICECTHNRVVKFCIHIFLFLIWSPILRLLYSLKRKHLYFNLLVCLK